VTVDTLTERIQTLAAQAPPLKAVVKFDLGADGVIRLDGTQSPPLADQTDGEAETVIKISRANLEKLVAGDLDPNFAFMTGKLKVNGAMGVAMKLTSVLGE